MTYNPTKRPKVSGDKRADFTLREDHGNVLLDVADATYLVHTDDITTAITTMLLSLSAEPYCHD